MSLTSNHVALIGLIVCMLHPVSLALSMTGPQQHLQQMVCDADFVIKGKILSQHITQENHFVFGARQIAHYEVNVTTVFKGIGIIRSDQSTIHRPLENCDDQGLEIGAKYLIRGFKNYDGQLQASQGCQWNWKWTELTSFQQKGLISESYLDNCNSCEITTDMFKNYKTHQVVLSVGNACSFDIRDAFGRALVEKHSCVMGCSGTEGCSWVRNDKYEDCFVPRRQQRKRAQNKKL